MDARLRDEVLAGGYAQGLEVGGATAPCGSGAIGRGSDRERATGSRPETMIAVRYVLPGGDRCSRASSR